MILNSYNCMISIWHTIVRVALNKALIFYGIDLGERERGIPVKKTEMKLPDAELEVMLEIWRGEVPVSTSDIKVRLDQNRPWNISALQTLLNRLIARGFLKSFKDGKSRYYEPLVDEKTYLAGESRTFLDRFYSRFGGGSLKQFVASLYDSSRITSEELEELEQFIREKKEDGRNA